MTGSTMRTDDHSVQTAAVVWAFAYYYPPATPTPTQTNETMRVSQK